MYVLVISEIGRRPIIRATNSAQTLYDMAHKFILEHHCSPDYYKETGDAPTYALFNQKEGYICMSQKKEPFSQWRLDLMDIVLPGWVKQVPLNKQLITACKDTGMFNEGE